MNWINKSHLKNTLIAAIVLWVFFAFCLDAILIWGIIKAGQAAAGAKVEIGSLRTSLRRGRLTIRRVAVANKSEPMKNIFELDEAALQFSPEAALRGKIVVPAAELKGFQFGTARKTSGALPRSKPSALEKMVAGQLAPARQNLEADLGKAKTIAAAVDPKRLESLKGLDAAQNALQNAGEELKSKLGVDKVDAQLKDLENQIKQLQGGGNSPADILRKAQQAADTQKQIKALLSQVDNSRAAVKAELDSVQSKLKQAEDLRHKDVNGLLAAAGLPTLDAESLTKHLLGPAASKKLSTALYWIAWARQRGSSQANKTRQKPQRRRGVNFEFPREHSYPQFLLEKAEISGKIDSLFAGRDMELAGRLSGVTSNPPLYGRPARLTLKGSAQGGPSMGLEAALDRTREPGSMDLQLHYAGLPLSGLSLGDSGLGASLKAGLGRLDGSIRITGDQWNGQVVLQASEVALEPQLKLAGPAAGYAAAALSGIKRFTVTVGISGQENNLRLALSSDLGQTLADGLKQAFSGELAKQRKLIEDQVNALYAGRAKDLQGQADGLRKTLLGPLERQQAQLQDQLKRAVSKSLGRSIPGLDKFKLFR